MQLPSHILLSYAVYSAVAPEANAYLVPFLISSIVVDIDHVPAYLLNKPKHTKICGALWRTRLHELYGATFFSFVIILVWLFNQTLAQILAVGIIMHYIIDFLTGETRPFFPYSNEKIQIFFVKSKIWLIILEFIFSFSLIGLILWKM